MSIPDIDKAQQFLAANARVLERRKFERYFAGGEAAPVRDAVAAYRNPDGGFGHALEPDGRSPGSQPLAIDFALRTLHDADAWDESLAAGACGWLAAHAPAGGGAMAVDPAIVDWPHAPWWEPEEGSPPNVVTTGLLAGTLHARGVTHPWLDAATTLLWSRIDALDKPGPYDVRGLLWFCEHVPDRERASKALDRIGQMMSDLHLVALDPQAPGEVHFPLDYAPLPRSAGRRFFSQSLIDTHLDHLAASQREDGGWTFNWPAWSPAAERDWRGFMTVEALRVLRANGRL
jgi:hypothetical protein